VVTCTRSKTSLMIVARPNQSASWRANLYTLLALCVPSLGAAIAFAALGAWPILPFAGLEMLALGSALYYVNWKLQYRHVITLSEDSVRIDKGHYYPRQSWQLQRRRAGLSITPEQHPWESPALAVHDPNQRIGIGEFLNRDDAQELITLLRREMRVDSHSAKGGRRF
jgi:uncharacterized membrane protein